MSSIPRPEHPRPSMHREAWQNLNGEWDFAFDFSNSGIEREMYLNGKYDQKITVPFCPESDLSGIGYKDFIPAVWYKKEIEITEEQLNGRVILHFGAVDYLAEVYVNAKSVGTHSGGFSSFEFDITDSLVVGCNTVVVSAVDDVRSGKQPAGKQSNKLVSYGCYYTRTTGIWQTVWLEFVPKTYIKAYKLIPDPDNNQAIIKVSIGGDYTKEKLTAKAFFNKKQVGSACVVTTGNKGFITLNLSEVHLWDVGQPNLYDLELSLESSDTVKSYFGLRTIEWHDKAMYLNGKIVYQRLILDQGFFPDGIYTAPTDEALKRDIQLSMDLGFNGARMHEKVFEERYMYHADKLGYLTWGEMANWNLDITSADGIKHFMPEWLEIVERDFNHPSIVGWCPFNETWNNTVTGAKQDDSVLAIVYQATKAMDPTRPVIDTSGNYHVVTDIYDIHCYEQEPEIFREKLRECFSKGEVFENFGDRQTYGDQPYFISEYGGTWWSPGATGDNWGYGENPTTEEEVIRRYTGLTSALMEFPEICAFCYTQLTDVEQEQNGLYDYNRCKKFSDEGYNKIRQTNTAIAAIELKNQK